MNILLHICCAPCSISVIDDLLAEGHKIGGYFYNPNIHPYSEYLKRREEVEKYANEISLNVTYGDYEIDKYFQNVIYNEAANTRCPVCWWLRLSRAGVFAEDNGFDAFTTTLLASPYQDHEILKNIGNEVAKNIKAGFFYKDFRTGFNKGRDIARQKGMYLQKYCGCLYSEKDRIEKKREGISS